MSPVSEALALIQKIPSSFLAVLALVTAAILFVPAEYAAMLGIDQLPAQYRAFVGPGFLLTTAWLIVRFAGEVFKPIRARRARHATAEARLRGLTDEEKAYIAEFVIGRKTSIRLGMSDGVAANLKGRKVLWCPSQLIGFDETLVHNMQPWAREYFEQNPHLLAEAPPFAPVRQDLDGGLR